MKTHSSDLIKEINNNKKPVVITQNGVPKAIVMDVGTYERQRDTFMLLKLIAQGEQEIKKKKVIEQDKVFDKLDKKIRKDENI